jgi:uncharacterized FlaG/YvyC family protein
MVMKIGGTENGWQAVLPFAKGRNSKSAASSSEPGREDARAVKSSDAATRETSVSVIADLVKEQAKDATKAYFAIDDNKNVVIRVVDSKGNVIQQIPSEAMQKMAEEFKAKLAAGDLFNMKA